MKNCCIILSIQRILYTDETDTALTLSSFVSNSLFDDYANIG